MCVCDCGVCVCVCDCGVCGILQVIAATNRVDILDPALLRSGQGHPLSSLMHFFISYLRTVVYMHSCASTHERTCMHRHTFTCSLTLWYVDCRSFGQEDRVPHPK